MKSVKLMLAGIAILLFGGCSIPAFSTAAFKKMRTAVVVSNPKLAKSASASFFKVWYLLVAAKREGALLGYAGLEHVLDEGYLTDVAVFPEHRRHGDRQLNRCLHFLPDQDTDLLGLLLRALYDQLVVNLEDQPGLEPLRFPFQGYWGHRFGG